MTQLCDCLNVNDSLLCGKQVMLFMNVIMLLGDYKGMSVLMVCL